MGDTEGIVGHDPVELSESSDPESLSQNDKRIRMNSITRSSVNLQVSNKLSNECMKARKPETHIPESDSNFAIVKYTAFWSNSTLHFHSSHFSPGFHSERH